MARTRWTNRLLDEMRQAGDPPADAVVQELFETDEIGAVNHLMTTLVRNDDVPTAKLPKVVRSYLEFTDDLPAWADPQRIAIGEEFFGVHGPTIVMAFACASLPKCYAFAKGVQRPARGAGQLGATVTDDEADAHLHAWNVVGHVMGIDQRLLAHDVDQARKLWAAITRRQWAQSAEGRAMTQALIEAMEHRMPGTVFDGFPAQIVRFLCGDELADMLGVDSRGWTSLLSGPLRLFTSQTDAVTDHLPVAGTLLALLTAAAREPELGRARRRPGPVPDPAGARRAVGCPHGPERPGMT